MTSDPTTEPPTPDDPGAGVASTGRGAPPVTPAAAPGADAAGPANSGALSPDRPPFASELVSTVTVVIDGNPVEVPEGTSLLGACAAAGVDTPTLCFDANLTPVNACRVCVVEVEGSRTLVPSCSRRAEDGMVVATGTDRVDHSRRMVLELLGSGVDLSQADDLAPWIERYGARPDRYGPDRATMDEPVRIQDDLYIRDYDKCVLCYKCVEACGDDAQHTFAIAVSGRGFGARIATEFDTPLPDSACVYCGNCIAVCPTNALQFKTEFDLRSAGAWRPDEQTVTRTVCSYCGVGCNLELHVQDERIVKVTSPADHDVTRGMLCIKGRFGWSYVQGASDPDAPTSDASGPDASTSDGSGP